MEPEPTVTVLEHGGAVIGRRARLVALALALLLAAAVALTVSVGSGAPKSPRAVRSSNVAVSMPVDMKNDGDEHHRDADDR